MNCVQTCGMVQVQDEQARLGETVGRLRAIYPTLPVETITEVVHDMHTSFNGAPIREFVPLFVERRARSALAELSVSYA